MAKPPIAETPVANSDRPKVAPISRSFFFLSLLIPGAISFYFWIPVSVYLVAQALAGKPISRPPWIAGWWGLVMRDATRLVLSVLAAPFLTLVPLVFVYRIWKSIQSFGARTTPGKAVGLLFVPFFNLYWVFVAYWGFARDFNTAAQHHGLPVPRVSQGLALAICILGLLSVIPLFGIFTGFVGWMLFLVFVWQVCTAVNALSQVAGEWPAVATHLRGGPIRRLTSVGLSAIALGVLATSARIVDIFTSSPSPLLGFLGKLWVFLLPCGIALAVWGLIALRKTRTRGRIRALVVASVLGALALGLNILVSWGVAEIARDWEKHEVPWPKGCRVSRDFRLLSLPQRFGPYARLTATGELPGVKDGEIILDEDAKAKLGIGMGNSATHYANRRSNWYLSRVYVDTREPAGSSWRHWRLHVAYHTEALGGPVPHVPRPDPQLSVAGATVVNAGVETFPSVVGPSRPWDQPLVWRRVDYEDGRRSRLVRFHLFSVNGEPTSDRLRVRGTLSQLGEKYCYFAQIQFGPCSAVSEREEIRSHAQEFARHFLPAVLKNLPMRPDIEKMGDGSQER